MIAHRLKNIRNTDQIIVIDDGKINNIGTHDALMKKNGIYKKFIKAREYAVNWKIG